MVWLVGFVVWWSAVRSGPVRCDVVRFGGIRLGTGP